MSTVIQRGVMSIMIAINKPIGFMLSALMKSPFVNKVMERVAPQEGQGMSIAYFIRQTSTDLFSVKFFEMLK
ncbi:hypothetical protein [uncultured Roseivirga sp.]|uniref:hypothetical protein n=1 Tax=uncultured Roseivirga sp. TaxID=543088 RepID=UPI0030D935FD